MLHGSDILLASSDYVPAVTWGTKLLLAAPAPEHDHHSWWERTVCSKKQGKHTARRGSPFSASVGLHHSTSTLTVNCSRAWREYRT